jgi:hypothetical protein
MVVVVRLVVLVRTDAGEVRVRVVVVTMLRALEVVVVVVVVVVVGSSRTSGTSACSIDHGVKRRCR